MAALDPDLVPLLEPRSDPAEGECRQPRPGSIPIPADLSPAHGRKGHLRRLLWTQQQLPILLKAHGSPLLVSPLPEAPLLRGVRSVVLAHDLLPLRYPQPSPCWPTTSAMCHWCCIGPPGCFAIPKPPRGRSMAGLACRSAA